MFREWGFLLGEIWFLLALAGLFGLIAGWLIWGNPAEKEAAAQRQSDAAKPDLAELDRLRAENAACRTRAEADAARVKALTAELADLKGEVTRPSLAPPSIVTQSLIGGAAAPRQAAVALSRPEALAGPRDGKADDLKLIKGIGPKLEALCHKLGFYHFDQIAKWSAAEVAWVDENLEGFKGRVSRENWIVQARDLAAGLPARPGGEN